MKFAEKTKDNHDFYYSNQTKSNNSEMFRGNALELIHHEPTVFNTFKNARNGRDLSHVFGQKI